MSQDGKLKISIAKCEASRKNGAKSNGPATIVGKLNSRKNAQKHGLLSTAVILAEPESRQAITLLVKELTDDMKPEGKLEQLLVEQIAVCFWRLRRVLVAESGEISAATSRKLSRRESQNDELAFQMRGSLFTKNEISPDLARERASKLKKTSAGIAAALQLLEMVERCASLDGYFGSEYDDKVFNVFADDPYFYGFLLSQNKALRSAELNAATRDESISDVFATISPLSLIRAKIKDLSARQKETIRTEALEAEQLRRSLNLPSSAKSEKILRYETTIQRQLYKAMDQLERLQRQRQGEYVPPPAKLAIQKDE